MSPRARFVTAATALSLHRGGMALSRSLVAALADARQALPAQPTADMLRSVRIAADAVLDAHRAGDENRYAEAHYRLATQAGLYWALKLQEAA